MSQIPQIRLSRHKGIFITGIDTNVGKTILTATLGVALQKQGFRLGVMKPVETGIHQSTSELEADGLRLQRILSTDDPSDIVTSYQFADPLAPLAARIRIMKNGDVDSINLCFPGHCGNIHKYFIGYLIHGSFNNASLIMPFIARLVRKKFLGIMNKCRYRLTIRYPHTA